MSRISYRFLVPGWSARPLVSAYDRIMGTHKLEAENEELKAALGEAPVQLRVWKRGAEHLPPLRS